MKNVAIKILIYTFLLSVSISFCSAQNRYRFEVTPHAGYRWGGTLEFSNAPTGPGIPTYNKLSLQGSSSYGIGGGFYVTPQFLVDFDWMRQGTAIDAQRVNGGTDKSVADFTLNTYHFGLNYFISQPEAKVRPYVRVGLGWTSSRPEVSGVSTYSRFSSAVGGGVKFYPIKHFSIGAQIQYMPAFLYSTTDGVWCGWYSCWTSNNNHYLHQADVSLLLGFRF